MITLEEIENITFRKSGLGGYKIDEVDHFVDDVVDKVKSLELAQRELELKIENQQAEIKNYKEKEDSVQNALISAQVSAKQIKSEAEKKAQEKLDEADSEAEKTISEAKEEAEKLLAEAKEKAEQINADTDAKVEELMNKALRESSDKIDENNRILEEQKKNIIKLMGEANKFRNHLLKEYKNHLSIINSMSKGEDFKKKQAELDKNYPKADCNKPVETKSSTKEKNDNNDSAEEN